MMLSRSGSSRPLPTAGIVRFFGLDSMILQINTAVLIIRTCCFEELTQCRCFRSKSEIDHTFAANKTTLVEYETHAPMYVIKE
jgi:hypothetical protein